MTVSVADPTTLQVSGSSFFDGEVEQLHAAHGRLAAAGRNAIITTWNLGIYDVGDPLSPASLTGASSSGGNLGNFGVLVAGPDRILSGVPTSLTEYVLDEGQLVENGRLPVGCRDILMVDGLVMTVGNSGLTIGNGGPMPPIPWASVSPSGGGFSFREGDLLYVANHGGLGVVDMTDPMNPLAGSRQDLLNNYIHPPLAKYGSVIYTNTGDEYLEVLDVSDPMEPASLGLIQTVAAVTWGLLIEGDLLYVAVDADGLQVLDVSDPMSPVLVGVDPSTGPSLGRIAKMVKLGDEVLVTADDGGVDVYNVANPQQPVETGHLAAAGEIRDLDLLGDTLIVSTFQGPMTFWRREATGWEYLTLTTAYGRTTAVHGDVIYSYRSYSEIGIFRFVDGQIEPINNYIGASAQDFMLVADDYVAAGGASSILFFPSQCLDITSSVEVPEIVAGMLNPAVPNPFNPTTELSFEMPRAGDAELVLYDAAGRRVRTLHSGMAAAGTVRVRWDGRDENGRAVASGVYLARLRMGEHVESRKLALLR